MRRTVRPSRILTKAVDQELEPWNQLGDQRLQFFDDRGAITDNPRIRSLGLARQVASVIGSEVTSTSHSEAAPHTFGHVNVFPLPYQPDQYRGGSTRGEGRRLRDLIADELNVQVVSSTASSSRCCPRVPGLR